MLVEFTITWLGFLSKLGLRFVSVVVVGCEPGHLGCMGDFRAWRLSSRVQRLDHLLNLFGMACLPERRTEMILGPLI